MRRFLLTLTVVTNNKKITAIRDMRSATGMGLLPAKTFVETSQPNMGVDAFGGTLIVNGDQAARIMCLVHQPYITDTPRYFIEKIEEIKDQAIDVSTLLM